MMGHVFKEKVIEEKSEGAFQYNAIPLVNATCNPKTKVKKYLEKLKKDRMYPEYWCRDRAFISIVEGSVFIVSNKDSFRFLKRLNY